MSQLLYTKTIGERIRSLIWTNLESSLSLQASHFGDIQYYESAEELDDFIPAVFVKPSPNVTIQVRTMNLKYTIIYRYKIIYVKTFSVASQVVEDKVDNLNSIVELLFNNTDLNGLTLTDADIEKSVPTTVEYEPVEEGFLALLKGQYVAGAVNVEVTTHTASP